MCRDCADLTEVVAKSGHGMAQEEPVDVNVALSRWLATKLPDYASPSVPSCGATALEVRIIVVENQRLLAHEREERAIDSSRSSLVVCCFNSISASSVDVAKPRWNALRVLPKLTSG